MTGALQEWLRIGVPSADVYPTRREGRLTIFTIRGHVSMGRPTYKVLSSRGGFAIGHVEFRNQWQAWSYMPLDGVPHNLELLAQVYAFLRELGGTER